MSAYSEKNARRRAAKAADPAAYAAGRRERATYAPGGGFAKVRSVPKFNRLAQGTSAEARERLA